MRVSVIIPTLNPGDKIKPLIHALLEQTVQAEIIVVDSQSDDGSVAALGEFGDAVRLISISGSDFDHGGTRAMALAQSTGDVILFLTQDAMPADRMYMEELLKSFEDEQVAAAFGRQIAFSDAPDYEKLTREFNYPPASRTWTAEQVSALGIKAYFFSDVCSAYRRSAYFDVGGFDRPVRTNEDMLIAAKFIHGGYRLAYCAEAAVFHSHRLSLRQEFRRNAQIAGVIQQYKDRLVGAECNSEGFRLAMYVLRGLVEQFRFGQALIFSAHAGAKWLGFEYGKRREQIKALFYARFNRP